MRCYQHGGESRTAQSAIEAQFTRRSYPCAVGLLRLRLQPPVLGLCVAAGRRKMRRHRSMLRRCCPLTVPPETKNRRFFLLPQATNKP
jgi:hypothetical protein